MRPINPFISYQRCYYSNIATTNPISAIRRSLNPISTLLRFELQSFPTLTTLGGCPGAPRISAGESMRRTTATADSSRSSARRTRWSTTRRLTPGEQRRQHNNFSLRKKPPFALISFPLVGYQSNRRLDSGPYSLKFAFRWWIILHPSAFLAMDVMGMK